MIRTIKKIQTNTQGASVSSFFLILSLFSSCAWNQKEVKTYKKQGDLVKKFEINNDQIKKFAEKEITKPAIKKTKVSKKIAIKKTKINKVIPLKIKPKKLRKLPKDYPKKYFKYDKASARTWKSFKPIYLPGEVIIMDIKYLGITAGKIIIRTMDEKTVGGSKAYHYNANMKSAPFYSAIYSLDDHLDTYIKKTNFTPIKYSLVQRESGQKVDDLQLFDHEKRKTFFWYDRLKKKKQKKYKKEGYVPQFFQDSFSALFFVRGLPLKKGQIYKFPVITRTKLWELKAEVVGIENIKVKRKTVNAIKLRVETQFPGVLKKKGDINFWYSNDKDRRLLKFNANVKIGNVVGELSDYYFEK